MKVVKLKIKITPKEEMQEDIKVYKYGFSIRNDIKKVFAFN